MTGPTPGPWHAIIEEDQPQPLYSGLVCLLQHGDEYKAVVTENGAVSWAEQWEANAKLIAAAPTLLRACESAEEIIVSLIDLCGDSGAGLVLREVQAAIEKAKS